MTNFQLKRLRKQLPAKYGKVIADNLNTSLIDAQKVVKVMHGHITDPNITIPVLDAAAQLIENSKKVNKRVSKALKAA